VVTRRLFRTGDSEYLLNGKLCRLRDIQELFNGYGSGAGDYALDLNKDDWADSSSRPTDRRAIIEEAAVFTNLRLRNGWMRRGLESQAKSSAGFNDF